MDWKMLYCLLFNRITDALRELERKNYGMAEELLKAAQQETEAAYLNSGSTEE